MSCTRKYSRMVCFPPWTERNSIFIQGARPVTVYHRLPVRNRLRLLIAQHMTVTVQHPPFSSHFPHSLTEPCVRARVRARAPSALKCKCNSTVIISFIVQFHAVADLCGNVIHELHQMCHAKRKPLVKNSSSPAPKSEMHSCFLLDWGRHQAVESTPRRAAVPCAAAATV